MKILIVAFLLTLIEFFHSQSNYFRSVPIPVSIYFSGMALQEGKTRAFEFEYTQGKKTVNA